MKINVLCSELSKALQFVMGGVERRHTFPILANVLLRVANHSLRLTTTDLEVELSSYLPLTGDYQEGEITVPARKLLDICRSLDANCSINLAVVDDRVSIQAQRSRFTLTTLPAADFPHIDESLPTQEFHIESAQLLGMLECTQFAIAQQDVRYFLNGMLWEIGNGKLVVCAMDGHRLASSEQALAQVDFERVRMIVPKKGVVELTRLLNSLTETILIKINSQHVQIHCDQFTLTSKLIDSSFPDYRGLITQSGHLHFVAEKARLKQILSRVSILSNDLFNTVALDLSDGLLRVRANNPDQEQAEDEMAVEYQGEPIVFGFNVCYLLDCLAVIADEKVKFTFTNAEKGVFIESLAESANIYFIMPLRL